MIKFEEHDNQLFRMLEKPVQLKEKNTNVLVQFITHGVIGEYVMEHWLDCGQENAPIFVDSVDSDGDVIVCIENGNKYGCPFPMFEIIGYPVEEGSRWWALYQMMQGKKVSHKGDIGNVCLALNQDGDVQYYDMDNLAYIGTIRSKLEFGKKDVVKTGWQIYKEPEHESQYKVGDWVEVHGCCQARVINIEYSSISGEAKYATLSSNNRIRISYITRKLDPSEVVIRIGCLSGTVEKSQFHKNGFILVTAAGNCWILFDALDKETSDLVEGLLKAQENDK